MAQIWAFLGDDGSNAAYVRLCGSSLAPLRGRMGKSIKNGKKMITFGGPRLMRRGSIDAVRRGGGPLVRTKQTQRVEQSFRSPITRTRARHGGGSITVHVYRERAIIHT